MDAVAEGDVSRCGAVQVEAVGVGETAGVAVGGAEREQHGLARGHGDARDRDVLHREAADGEGRGTVVALELLDGGGESGGVVAQGGELLRVVEEGEDGVADEVDGVLVPGDEDEEGERHQLVLAQPVALVPHRDQVGEEVVGGVLPLVGEEPGEEAEHGDDGVLCLLRVCGVG